MENDELIDKKNYLKGHCSANENNNIYKEIEEIGLMLISIT